MKIGVPQETCAGETRVASSPEMVKKLVKTGFQVQIEAGAGVAGLQAIATARRMGCDVHAYDVRPETQEQIQSLGAKDTIEGMCNALKGGGH